MNRWAATIVTWAAALIAALIMGAVEAIGLAVRAPAASPAGALLRAGAIVLGVDLATFAVIGLVLVMVAWALPPESGGWLGRIRREPAVDQRTAQAVVGVATGIVVHGVLVWLAAARVITPMENRSLAA